MCVFLFFFPTLLIVLGPSFFPVVCVCVFFPRPIYLSWRFFFIRSFFVNPLPRSRNADPESHCARSPPRSPERLVHCTFCRARRLESFLPRGTLLWSVVQSPFGTPIYSASPNAQKMVYNTWYTANTFREYTVQLQQYVMYDTEKNNKRSQPPTK